MKVFITGITGTLGTAIAQYHSSKGDTVVGCCRSESKLAHWLVQHGRLGKAILGDCVYLKDRTSDVYKLLQGSNKVYHCAALKHVDLCEKQPVEAYRQNIWNIDIISDLCSTLSIPLTFISTDKACLPQGVYGATKLIGEQITLSRGGSVVRFGNLIGSSGSVFQKWEENVRLGKAIQLTDPEMTRYFLPVEEAARFSAEQTIEGIVTIPVMKAIQLGELANKLSAYKVRIETIGRRPGETQHQWLIATGDIASVDYHAGRIKLGVGDVTPGMSSENAERWNARELLDIALGV